MYEFHEGCYDAFCAAYILVHIGLEIKKNSYRYLKQINFIEKNENTFS